MPQIIFPQQTASVTFLIACSLLFACSTFDGPPADPDTLFYPVGIALHPSGDYLYVLNTNFDAKYNSEQGGSVTVIDTATNQILADQTVLLQSYGGELALGNFDDSGNPRSLYAVTRGANNLVVLTLNEFGNQLSCAGATSENDGTQCDIPYLSPDPFGVIALPNLDDSRELVAIASLSGIITLVSLENGDVSSASIDETTVLNGASTMAIYPPTGELFISGRFSNSMRGLHWIDDESLDGYISSNITIANAADTLEIRDIVFSAERERAYLTADRPDSVIILDMSLDEDGQPKGTYIGRIALQGSPSQATLVSENGQDILYVVLSNAESLIAINLDTEIIEDTIPIGENPFGLATDTNNHKLYITLFREHAVTVVDIDPNSPTFRMANVHGRIE